MSNLYSESERIKTLESRIFALKDEVARIKAEWIDPQRIVDLAKRHTDEGHAGRIDLSFTDFDPTFGHQWELHTIGHHFYTGHTANDALKEAEA